MSLTDRAHEESHNKELASAGLGGRQRKQFHVFIVQSSSLSVVQHHIVKRQKLCEKNAFSPNQQVPADIDKQRYSHLSFFN